MFTQRVFARYFQSAFFCQVCFDLNDASLGGTSASVLLTSLAPPLFADMSSWNASEEAIPGFRRCLDIWYRLLLFCHIACLRLYFDLLLPHRVRFVSAPPPPLTDRSIKWITIIWLRQQKKRDVALRLDNCNYNLDLMRLLPVCVYLCVWMEQLVLARHPEVNLESQT